MNFHRHLVAGSWNGSDISNSYCPEDQYQGQFFFPLGNWYCSGMMLFLNCDVLQVNAMAGSSGIEVPASPLPICIVQKATLQGTQSAYRDSCTYNLCSGKWVPVHCGAVSPGCQSFEQTCPTPPNLLGTRMHVYSQATFFVKQEKKRGRATQ